MEALSHVSRGLGCAHSVHAHFLVPEARKTKSLSCCGASRIPAGNRMSPEVDRAPERLLDTTPSIRGLSEALSVI